jgi:succinyl-diaminopimelate desuccinylase
MSVAAGPLAAELIACRTENPPGNEATACAVVERYLQARGLEPEIRELGEGRANLVLRIPGAGGPGLMFSGHLDVVPAHPEEWLSPPFDPTVDGDRLVGRGSTDMKGAVAAMAGAFASLAARDETPRGDLVLALTAGEEVDSVGAKQLVSDGVLDRLAWVVIGEPTGMDVGIAHKGALWVAAEASGVAAHGSQPEMGENAVLKLLKWLTPIEDFEQLVSAAPHPLLGAPTCSLNVLHGGQAPNIVPDHARAVIDFRTLPGQAHGGMLIDLGMRGAGVELTVLRDAPGIGTPADSPLVEAACEASAAASGRQAQTRGLPYVTDGSVYAQALGAEVVLLGPGDEKLAHQADEWVSLAALESAAAAYQDLADRLLYR